MKAGSGLDEKEQLRIDAFLLLIWCTAYRYRYYRYLVLDKFFLSEPELLKKKTGSATLVNTQQASKIIVKKGEWNLKVDTPCLVSWNMCVAFHAHLWTGAGWEAAGQPGHTHTIEPSVQYSSIQPLHNNNQHCLVSNGYPEKQKTKKSYLCDF